MINAHELVSLKLLAIGLAKDQATNWNKIKQAEFSIDTLESIAQLLLTATKKPKMSQLRLKEQRRDLKIEEDIVSPLDMVTNRYKRMGVLGNYVQILMSVSALRKDFKNSKLYVPYTEE